MTMQMTLKPCNNCGSRMAFDPQRPLKGLRVGHICPSCYNKTFYPVNPWFFENETIEFLQQLGILPQT